MKPKLYDMCGLIMKLIAYRFALNLAVVLHRTDNISGRYLLDARGGFSKWKYH